MRTDEILKVCDMHDDLMAEIARLRDALELAVSDFGDGHCVCEDTKQMCIAALSPHHAATET